MLSEVFCFVQRAGAMDLEPDPTRSHIFSNPEFLLDRPTREFVCDSPRMLVLGVTSSHELDNLLELDIDVQPRARREPIRAMHSVADAFPGLGIVAGGVGVVITMQAISGSPETVGQKVAGALVGTFVDLESTIRRDAKVPAVNKAASEEAPNAAVQSA
jgi:chemotaxis protein MotA